jgi:hypothetical protein
MYESSSGTPIQRCHRKESCRNGERSSERECGSVKLAIVSHDPGLHHWLVWIGAGCASAVARSAIFLAAFSLRLH